MLGAPVGARQIGRHEEVFIKASPDSERREFPTDGLCVAVRVLDFHGLPGNVGRHEECRVRGNRRVERGRGRGGVGAPVEHVEVIGDHFIGMRGRADRVAVGLGSDIEAEIGTAEDPERVRGLAGPIGITTGLRKRAEENAIVHRHGRNRRVTIRGEPI